MVAKNPLFSGGEYYKKFKATVISDIWPEILFFTLIATMVTLVSDMTDTKLVVPTQILTVLGTVLGFVISFRTSTAYERFSEGRKLWTSIAQGSRILAQIIWIHVPNDRKDEKTEEKKPVLPTIIEKKSLINLVQAYSVSVKHLLRGEGGVYYSDLYPLISFLPRFATQSERGTNDDMLPLWRASHSQQGHAQAFPPRNNVHRAFTDPGHTSEDSMDEKDSSWLDCVRSRPKKAKPDPDSALPLLPSEYPLRPASNPPKASICDYLPFLRIFRFFMKRFNQRIKEAKPVSRSRTLSGKMVRPKAADSNVPMEITLFLNSYFAALMRQGLLSSPSATAMNNAITALQDTVANLQRVGDTPLPFAYQVHLRMSLWIYLFFLPFQLWDTFRYFTIPATAIVSFIFVGFLEIGQEIENPFNYSYNDLDLDQFCLVIQRELHEVTAHTCPEPEDYIFSEWNQPFAPADRRNAKEMVDDANHDYHGVETGMHSIRSTLLKSWRDVDELTRR